MNHEANGSNTPKTSAEPPIEPIIVYIENAYRPELGGVTIPLPAAEREIRNGLEKIDAYGRGDDAIGIYDIRSDVPGLAVLMPLDVTLNDLDYLAALIANMSGGEYEMFSAAIEKLTPCGGIDEIICFAETVAL